MRVIVIGVLALLTATARPIASAAQSSAPPSAQTSTAPTSAMPPQMLSLTNPTDTRIEVTLDGRIGVPTGYLRVGENQQRGTYRTLDQYGINVSEALAGGVAFHFTQRDAVRASFLYYFLDGTERTNRLISYNGDVFGPSNVHTNADFQRYSLDYERLLSSRYGGFLWGTVGLTYVYFDPKLRGQGHSSAEDFFRQELPVPIVGVRADIPLGERFAARASLSVGGLPHIDSGRKEGGTVYLEQAHGDIGLGIVYAVTRTLLIDASYYFTYFTQHEKSHEDDNVFQLIDNGLRAGVTFRF